MIFKHISIVVGSQTNIIVQSIDAEAKNHPVLVCGECSLLANHMKLPVVLLGLHEEKSRQTFEPKS